MKLSELNPSWHTHGECRYLYFACPHCKALDCFQVRVALQGQPVNALLVDHTWQYNGETDFDKLTITPSLNLKGHAHINITNGMIIVHGDSPAFIS